MLSAHILRGQMPYTYILALLTHLEPTMMISDGQIPPDSMTHPCLTHPFKEGKWTAKNSVTAWKSLTMEAVDGRDVSDFVFYFLKAKYQ